MTHGKSHPPTPHVHLVTVTARRFRWLRKPTVTNTFEKEGSCVEAEAIAAAARLYGAAVHVEHVDHEATS